MLGSVRIAAALAMALIGLVLVPGPGAAGGSDDRAGGGRGTPATQIALDHVRENPGRYGLESDDVDEIVVTDVSRSEHTGVTHVYLRQAHRGLEVLGGEMTVNVADGAVVYADSGFVSSLDTAAAGTRELTPIRAARTAAQAARLEPKDLRVTERRGDRNRETVMTRAGIAERPIVARVAYQALESGRVRLAWNVDIAERTGEHWWNTSVDATTGAVLKRTDYVDHDNAVAVAAAVAPAAATTAGPESTATDGADYRVYALPLETPNDGDRTLVSEPADALSSPFGWHDTNGAAGPEFTVTRGNNVHAYTDVDANGIPDPGSDPDGGAGLDFDFPLDLSQNPSAYSDAAVTNLFYWNNIIHDVLYRYGFDEASGNFQVNNYGNPGLGNDDVRAEAQDGAGINNANFLTPVDGNRPRMQMFLWRHPRPNFLAIDPPSSAADTYDMTGAVFGPPFDVTGVAGPVVLADDGVDPVNDGCEPLVGFPTGSIALIDRGTCTFVQKVGNAQAAGATAVVIANNVAGAPIFLGGTAPSITIPSGMISLDDANVVKAGLPATGRAAAYPDRGMRDGDLDAGIIIHEYGHGVSNRLTGGPGINCLTGQEQMGEGWSDWLAMALTALPTESGPQGRGIGTYALFQPDRTALGIRPTQYSANMAINPSTYNTIQTAAVPHGVGYVWATMLWDLYWNLVAKEGFNPDPYGDWTTGGNNLAIQLVMDGMKFQGCSPGFVTGRDAILAADQALTGGDNQCVVWQSFARRGLGFSAVQGTSASRSDNSEAFDTHPDCHTFTGFFGPLEGGGLRTSKSGSTVPVSFSLAGDQGLAVLAPNSPRSHQVNCETLAALGPATATQSTSASVLSYDAETDRYTYRWKTLSAWKNTCRQLTVELDDGSVHLAYVRFS